MKDIELERNRDREKETQIETKPSSDESGRPMAPYFFAMSPAAAAYSFAFFWTSRAPAATSEFKEDQIKWD